MNRDDQDLAILAIAHYRRLWKVLEDLETLLWMIKSLNDDMQEKPPAED